ncbi:MAG: helix-turn-helix transcriptional regulator [Bacteroidetes bacterium]|nr:helix-turn-helix transcriptional regulator [Bacteroidota bacterium]
MGKRKYRITSQLRTLRFMNGEMTQQELADKLGVTRQTIAAIEKEKYSPSLELAFLIAEEFNTKVDDVFGFMKM